jgi:hypothetical protein
MDVVRSVACQIADYREQQSDLEWKIQELASYSFVNDEGDVAAIPNLKFSEVETLDFPLKPSSVKET